jgi:hypothetical protein
MSEYLSALNVDFYIVINIISSFNWGIFKEFICNVNP